MPSCLDPAYGHPNVSHLDRHEGYYKSTCAHTIVDPVTKTEFSFLKDELIRVELSHKVNNFASGLEIIH